MEDLSIFIKIMLFKWKTSFYHMRPTFQNLLNEYPLDLDFEFVSLNHKIIVLKFGGNSENDFSYNSVTAME